MTKEEKDKIHQENADLIAKALRQVGLREVDGLREKVRQLKEENKILNGRLKVAHDDLWKIEEELGVAHNMIHAVEDFKDTLDGILSFLDQSHNRIAKDAAFMVKNLKADEAMLGKAIKNFEKQFEKRAKAAVAKAKKAKAKPKKKGAKK
jgi:hypothetical protein